MKPAAAVSLAEIFTQEAVSDDVVRFNAFAQTLIRLLDSGLMALSVIYLNLQKPSNVPKIRR
jgi:hypothetical protein